MKLNEHLIEQIGIWTMRAILALGAVYCAATGKADAAGFLGVVIVVTFFWL